MRFTRRTFLGTAAAAVASACAPAPSAPASTAASATPKPIAVKGAWVAQTANQMIWPLALDAGYFKKYGIDLDLSYINGSTTAVAALIGGDIGMTTVSGTAVVTAQAAGTDLVMIAGFVNKAIFRVMAVSSITSLDQLRGKTIAVTRIGNADYFAWQTIAAKNGWKIDDFKFVNATDVQGQVTLLQTGNVQAIAVSPPNNILALKVGAHEILDTGSLNEPEQQVGVAALRKYLTDNRPAALGVVKASIEGIARWKKDPPFAKDVIKKYLKNDDQQFIDLGFSAYVEAFPETPYPTEPGMRRIIEQVTTQNAKAKDLKPAAMIDRSFVQELETSGFIKQIYGR